MKPVEPGFPDYPMVQVGAGRADVEALPAINVDGHWLSFWELTENERVQISAGARVVVSTLHYGRPISPFSLQVETVVRACRECGCTDELGCINGCSWVEEDLCSACEDDERADEGEAAPATAKGPV